MVVNIWLLLAVHVALPLALLRLLEQRGRAATAHGQLRPAPAGQEAVAQAAELPSGSLPLLRAYLTSALLWGAASVGLWVWLAATQGGSLGSSA